MCLRSRLLSLTKSSGCSDIYFSFNIVCQICLYSSCGLLSVTSSTMAKSYKISTLNCSEICALLPRLVITRCHYNAVDYCSQNFGRPGVTLLSYIYECLNILHTDPFLQSFYCAEYSGVAVWCLYMYFWVITIICFFYFLVMYYFTAYNFFYY